MNKEMKVEGSRLCKKVKVEISKKPDHFTVCHCESCRRWVGGTGMSFNAGQHLKFSDESLVGRFSYSDWAERGFCKNCGTHLFYRLKKTDHYFLYLGLFGDAVSPQFDQQEFIDEKPNYYAFANDTKVLTKAEGYQMLSAYLARL